MPHQRAIQVALRPFERLNGGFLINAENDSVLGWRQVEADHIGLLCRELRIVALTPALAAAEIDLLLAQRAPDVLNVDIAQRLGDQGPVPACKTSGRRLIEDRANASVRLSVIDAWGPGARQIFKPSKPLARKATAPQADRGRGCLELAGDVPRSPSLRRLQHDADPQQLPLLRGSRAQPSLELRAFFPAQMNLDCIRNHPDVESRRN